MVTSYVSSLTLRSAPRIALSEHQSDLVRASREVATGRLDDPGLALGPRVSRSMELRIEDGLMDRLITSNGLADARMRQTQNALDGIVAEANKVLQSITALPPSTTAVSALVTEARAALDQLVVALNASNGRTYLFGGTNAAERPIADYDGAPRAAVEAALVGAFGGASIPPLETPANVAAFITTNLAPVFDSPSWETVWSSASDTPLTTEAEPGFVLETSISANERPFRDLAMAYTMLGQLGIGDLRSDSRQVVIDSAFELIGSAISDVVQLQSELGLSQQAVERATARLHDDKLVVARQLSSLEAVDPAEAKVEVDRLSLQIEMSYALTARLSRLSLLNFA